MIDLIVVGTAVALSIIYFVFRIVKFMRRPAGSSACGCSSSDCSNCPMVNKSNSNCSM